MTNRKEYNPAHKENDTQARNAMLWHFNTVGLFDIKEHPNSKDIDLIYEEKGIGYELEMINKWTGGDYPYPVFNLLERKWHLFDGSHPLYNYFVIVCKNCEQFLIISSDKVKKYMKPEYMKNIICNVPTEGIRPDNMYQIPLSEFQLVRINWF